MRLATLLRQRPGVPLHSGIISAVVAVCLLLVGLDGWGMWQMRGAAIAADMTETANLAQSLAQHAHDILHSTGVILGGLRERVERDGLSQEGAVDRLQRVIALRLDEDPSVRGLAVFDAIGGLVAGGRAAARAGLNIEDRAYFEYHRTHTDRGVHVGPAIVSRADGQWSLTVSRRIDDKQGRFAGVILARIAVSFLQSFYNSFEVGPGGMITLAFTQGITVARSNGKELDIGADVSSGPVVQRLNAGQSFGSFRDVSPVDGLMRVVSFRTIDEYPLVIIMGHALDEVLAEWRASALLHLAISILVSVILALMGNRFARQVKMRQQVEHGYRMLAENSTDAIVCMSLDGQRSYASPAFTALTGWSLDEGIVGKWVDIIHPDDRPALLQVAPKLLAGAAQVTSCFRYICKDGSLLWVEGRTRLFHGVNGETQIISNVRDITDRRAAEAQVAALNQKLAALAGTDGLTGLANRRRFDEALAQEWRRVLREELPLSLLLVDVDRFKMFNDRYGHQRGDECLRLAATAMKQVARRPSDLTARYGGEEFVVLLPGVDAAGAAALADRILAAVQAAGIKHEDNLPAGVVTVSIGVATVMPSPDMEACDAAALVAAADAALYQAKRGGRNRVVKQTEIRAPAVPEIVSVA